MTRTQPQESRPKSNLLVSRILISSRLECFGERLRNYPIEFFILANLRYRVFSGLSAVFATGRFSLSVLLDPCGIERELLVDWLLRKLTFCLSRAASLKFSKLGIPRIFLFVIISLFSSLADGALEGLVRQRLHSNLTFDGARVPQRSLSRWSSMQPFF